MAENNIETGIEMYNRSEEVAGTGLENDGTEENKQQKKGAKKIVFSAHWIYVPTILLLIGALVWQFVRLDKLEKSQVKTQDELTAMTYHFSERIDGADADISGLDSYIGRVDSRVSAVSSAVSAMAPLIDNANMYAHSHYSDARLKKDIQEISHPLEKLLILQGVTYNWKTKEYPGMGFSDDPQIGLIAQDVEKVFPELVTTDARGYKQVDYERLTAVLIEAIKEQQKEIDKLKR